MLCISICPHWVLPDLVVTQPGTVMNLIKDYYEGSCVYDSIQKAIILICMCVLGLMGIVCECISIHPPAAVKPQNQWSVDLSINMFALCPFPCRVSGHRRRIIRFFKNNSRMQVLFKSTDLTREFCLSGERLSCCTLCHLPFGALLDLLTTLPNPPPPTLTFPRPFERQPWTCRREYDG